MSPALLTRMINFNESEVHIYRRRFDKGRQNKTSFFFHFKSNARREYILYN